MTDDTPTMTLEEIEYHINLVPDGMPEKAYHRLCQTARLAVVRIPELEKLVYVPGLWRCAKCEFQLMQANLNAVDGTVTARDQPGDLCPNCNVPLWRVSERHAGDEMGERCEAAIVEAASHRERIAELEAENERLKVESRKI